MGGAGLALACVRACGGVGALFLEVRQGVAGVCQVGALGVYWSVTGSGCQSLVLGLGLGFGTAIESCLIRAGGS